MGFETDETAINDCKIVFRNTQVDTLEAIVFYADKHVNRELVKETPVQK